MTVIEQLAQARQAAYRLTTLSTETRNQALLAAAGLIESSRDQILVANRDDLSRADDLIPALHKRLIVTDDKIKSITASLRSVVDLPDPVGEVLVTRELDDDLLLQHVRVPIGVIGVIFESRPDALVQIASLAIKSGNAVILKGGSEARESNRVLHGILTEAFEATSQDFRGAVHLVESREDVSRLLSFDRDIDLMIPRGSNELVRFIQDNTRIPVLGHADGVCHLYINADADAEMAIRLAVDSKTQYPAVCNAMETLLLHVSQVDLLPLLARRLPDVEIRGCPRVQKVIDVVAATQDDWTAEYNDMVLAIRVVDSMEEAITHINTFGSHHTDGIVCSDQNTATRFMREVDSSSVLWNASTRFADGFRYGLGAEVGISTGKVHARGPVGLEGLTTTQYRVRGKGHIVADYADGSKSFTHRTIT